VLGKHRKQVWAEGAEVRIIYFRDSGRGQENSSGSDSMYLRGACSWYGKKNSRQGTYLDRLLVATPTFAGNRGQRGVIVGMRGHRDRLRALGVLARV